MKFKGILKGISKDTFNSGKYQITFEMTEGNIEEVNRLKDKVLAIDAKQHRDKRSLSANGMLWACLQDIANHFGGDKWDFYIDALRKYGQYEVTLIKPEALQTFKHIYRECEVIGARTVDGEAYIEIICYFGSSTYNTKEFARLLDGVVDDMKQAGIQTPTSEEMQRALEEMANEEAKKCIH